MKRDYIDYGRRFLAGFFLLLFCGYYANVTLFSHHHIVNGVTIVHSHLHSADHGGDNDSPTSGHSSKQLTLISALSHFASETPAPFVGVEPLVQIIKPHTNRSLRPFVKGCCVHTNLLRGPPTSLLVG